MARAHGLKPFKRSFDLGGRGSPTVRDADKSPELRAALLSEFIDVSNAKSSSGSLSFLGCLIDGSC